MLCGWGEGGAEMGVYSLVLQNWEQKIQQLPPESIEWFIEDQAFLPSDYFPPPPPSQQVVSLSQYSCVLPVELTDGRGGGFGRGAKSCHGEKAWSSIRNSILSGFLPIFNPHLKLHLQRIFHNQICPNTYFLCGVLEVNFLSFSTLCTVSNFLYCYYTLLYFTLHVMHTPKILLYWGEAGIEPSIIDWVCIDSQSSYPLSSSPNKAIICKL